MDAAFFDRPHEASVVALVLVRIVHSKLADCVIKGSAGGHIARDHGRVAGAGRRPRQGLGTQPRIGLHQIEIEALNNDTDLRIAKLANVKVAAASAFRPSQKYVARGLHQTLVGDDALEPAGTAGQQGRVNRPPMIA